MAAAPALPARPAVLGGESSPFVRPPDVPGLFLIALLMGFFSGSMSAVLGPGGGFLAVPALMGIGLRGAPAVGSELAALCLFGILCGLDHFKAAAINLRLALWLAAGALLGAAGGAFLASDMYFQDPNVSDAFVTALSMFVLAACAALAAMDLKRHLSAVDKPAPSPDEGRDENSRRGEDKSIEKEAETAPEAGRKVGLLDVPLDPAAQDGAAGPFWMPLCLGVVAGFLTVNAGAVGMLPLSPLLAQGLGYALAPAAGAQFLAAGLASGLAASIVFAPQGLVMLTVTAGLLLGQLSGMRLGAPAVRVMTAINVKSFVLAVTGAVALGWLAAVPAAFHKAGLAQVPQGLLDMLRPLSAFLFFMAPLSFAIWIFIAIFGNVAALRDLGRLNARALLACAGTTLAALALLVAMATPTAYLDQPLLGAADDLMLSRLKSRGLPHEAAEAALREAQGLTMRANLAFREPDKAEAAAEMVSLYGFNVIPARLTLQVPYLDLGLFLSRVVRDSEAVFTREARPLFLQTGRPERESLFLLWQILGSLQAEARRQKLDKALPALKAVQRDYVEPAYNMQDVRPRIGDIGLFWIAAAICSLTAMALLWRAGGNAILLGLGISFLVRPRPPVRAEDHPQPAPEKAASAPPAKDKTQPAPASPAPGHDHAKPPAAAAAQEAGPPPAAPAADAAVQTDAQQSAGAQAANPQDAVKPPQPGPSAPQQQPDAKGQARSQAPVKHKAAAKPKG